MRSSTVMMTRELDWPETKAASTRTAKRHVDPQAWRWQRVATDLDSIAVLDEALDMENERLLDFLGEVLERGCRCDDKT